MDDSQPQGRLDKELTALRMSGARPSHLIRVAYGQDLTALKQRHYRNRSGIAATITTLVLVSIAAMIAFSQVRSAQNERDEAYVARDALLPTLTFQSPIVMGAFQATVTSEYEITLEAQATQTQAAIIALTPVGLLPTSTPAPLDFQVEVQADTATVYAGSTTPATITIQAVNASNLNTLAGRPVIVQLIPTVGELSSGIFDAQGQAILTYTPPSQLEAGQIQTNLALLIDVPAGTTQETFYSTFRRGSPLSLTLVQENLQVNLQNSSEAFFALTETNNTIEVTFEVGSLGGGGYQGSYLFQVSSNVLPPIEFEIIPQNNTYRLALPIPPSFSAQTPITLTVEQLNPETQRLLCPNCLWQFTVAWAIPVTEVRTSRRITPQFLVTPDGNPAILGLDYDFSAVYSTRARELASSLGVYVRQNPLFALDANPQLAVAPKLVNEITCSTEDFGEDTVLLTAQAQLFLNSIAPETTTDPPRSTSAVCISPEASSVGLYELNFYKADGDSIPDFNYYLIVATSRGERIFSASTNQWQLVDPQSRTDIVRLADTPITEATMYALGEGELYIMEARIAAEGYSPLSQRCTSESTCTFYYLVRRLG